MDIYDPYVASDMQKGIFTTLEPYLDEVNNYIHTTAAANGVSVANVHQAYDGADGTEDPGAQGLIAVDCFHPNDAGHKLIADQLRALGLRTLSLSRVRGGHSDGGADVGVIPSAAKRIFDRAAVALWPTRWNSTTRSGSFGICLAAGLFPNDSGRMGLYTAAHEFGARKCC